MLKIQHLYHFFDYIGEGRTCENCHKRVSNTTTIYSGPRVILGNHCDKCLVKQVLNRAKFGIRAFGHCAFCSHNYGDSNSGLYLCDKFYCRKCILELYEYVADYLEGG